MLVVREVTFCDPTPEGIRLTSEQATQLYNDLGAQGFKCVLASVSGNHVVSVTVHNADAKRMEALIEGVKETAPDATFRTQGNSLDVL